MLAAFLADHEAGMITTGFNRDYFREWLEA
jgi:hypothetical protein